MYFYFGRASLVCLLVSLATFSLSARAQIPQPGDTSHTKLGNVGGGSKDTPESSSIEPPSVTTNGEGAAAKKKLPEEFLYFQVTKCISRRNLTLSDIEDVLRQKNDDGSQFSFTLADKLGYIVDDKYDPHIPVMRSHRAKLVALLEAMKKSLMASSQDKPKPVPAVSDEPPQVTSEPASDNNIHKIGFEVSKAIPSLSPEAIDRLLNNVYSMPGTLGYALGKELKYSDHDVHMKYLEKLKDDKVVALLRRILKSKLPKGTSSDGTPGESGGDKSELISKGIDRDSVNAKPHKASRHGQAGGPGNNATPLNGGPTDTRMPTEPNETKNPSEGGAWMSPGEQTTTLPASDKDIHRVGFDVSKAIPSLSPEAINRLLNNVYSMPGSLGYAVGQKLGYSDHDVHMEYLENLKEDELIALLRRILESKMPKGTSSDGTPGENGGDKSEPLSKEIDRDGGNAKHQEASKPEQAGGPGNNATPLNGSPTDTWMLTEPNETKNPSEGGGGGVSAPDEQNSQMAAPSGSEAGANSDRDGDGGAGDRRPGDGEPSSPTPSPPTQRTPPSREDVEDSGNEDDNERSRLPGDRTDDEQNYDHDDDDDLHVGVLLGTDEEQRMELVQSEGFQNYLATKYNELYEQFWEHRADPDKIDAALEEYIEWKSEIAVDEKGGGGSDGSYKEIKPESKQDAPAQPLDSDKVEGELGSFDDEEDEYDRPRSSSFGAWHFLSIFIVLGVMVVVGYVIMHNRKKLREGVTSYINDFSKRRKRAGEYKPLIST